MNVKWQDDPLVHVMTLAACCFLLYVPLAIGQLIGHLLPNKMKNNEAQKTS